MTNIINIIYSDYVFGKRCHFCGMINGSKEKDKNISYIHVLDICRMWIYMYILNRTFSKMYMHICDKLFLRILKKKDEKKSGTWNIYRIIHIQN